MDRELAIGSLQATKMCKNLDICATRLSETQKNVRESHSNVSQKCILHKMQNVHSIYEFVL